MRDSAGVLVTLGSLSVSAFGSSGVWYYRDGTTLPASPGVCFPIPKPADVRLSETSYFGAFTGTYDPMADAVFPATDAVDGGVTYGPTGTDYEGTGMNLAKLAKAIHHTCGTVWHVAVDGDDENDGLSWDTAKASPKNVIEAASAGELVLLGEGVFTLGNNGITTPDDVSILVPERAERF